MAIYLYQDDEITQTFDFQNDGDLSRTASDSAGICVAGQGWTIGNNQYLAKSITLTPPSNVYNGKNLNRVKFYMYKGIPTSYVSRTSYYVSVGITNGTYHAEWSTGGYANDRVKTNDSLVTTLNATGEVIVELSWGTEAVILTINGTPQSVRERNVAQFNNAWLNNQLIVFLEIYNANSSDLYLRKLELITEK